MLCDTQAQLKQVPMQHSARNQGHVYRYRLNIWDVGGQKTLRSYWRNYYEQTDALIWVVDTTDLHRLEDCRDELHNLLKEERLAGATLLIFANKQDLAGSLSLAQLQKVKRCMGPPHMLPLLALHA